MSQGCGRQQGADLVARGCPSSEKMASASCQQAMAACTPACSFDDETEKLQGVTLAPTISDLPGNVQRLLQGVGGFVEAMELAVGEWKT